VRESYLASQMRNPIHPGVQNITYFDSQPDVAIIRSEKYSLRISEECFAGEAWMIVGSLVSLDYARLLDETQAPSVATCAPSRSFGPALCGNSGRLVPAHLAKLGHHREVSLVRVVNTATGYIASTPGVGVM
jgi:hypothetical protein